MCAVLPNFEPIWRQPIHLVNYFAFDSITFSIRTRPLWKRVVFVLIFLCIFTRNLSTHTIRPISTKEHHHTIESKPSHVFKWFKKFNIHSEFNIWGVSIKTEAQNRCYMLFSIYTNARDSFEFFSWLDWHRTGKCSDRIFGAICPSHRLLICHLAQW